MKLATCAALAILAATGCKKEVAGPLAKLLAATKDFWPEAPKPTVTSGKRKLAYQPENLHGYAIEGKVGTAPGAEAIVSFDMTIAFELVAGATPTSRNAMLRRMRLAAVAPGDDNLTVEVDGAQITLKDPADNVIRTFKRGDTDPVNVGDVIDKPFLRIDFGGDGTVALQNDSDPLRLDDNLDSALIMFPDLPPGDAEVGRAWTVKRMATVSESLDRFFVDYQFVYAGDGPCPSGAGTCAHLLFTAGADKVKMARKDGTATYRFVGKVFLDAKGAIDESRYRVDIDTEVEGHKLPTMTGVYVVKPT